MVLEKKTKFVAVAMVVLVAGLVSLPMAQALKSTGTPTPTHTRTQVHKVNAVGYADLNRGEQVLTPGVVVCQNPPNPMGASWGSGGVCALRCTGTYINCQIFVNQIRLEDRGSNPSTEEKITTGTNSDFSWCYRDGQPAGQPTCGPTSGFGQLVKAHKTTTVVKDPNVLTTLDVFLSCDLNVVGDCANRQLLAWKVSSFDP